MQSLVLNKTLGHFTGTTGHTQRLCVGDEDFMTDDELFSFSHMCKSNTIMTNLLS